MAWVSRRWFRRCCCAELAISASLSTALRSLLPGRSTAEPAHHGGSWLTAASRATVTLRSPPEASPAPLCHVLRSDVDRPFPVQALEQRGVRAVERLEVRAAGDPQVERVVGRPRRRTVERQVEALKAKLGVG